MTQPHPSERPVPRHAGVMAVAPRLAAEDHVAASRRSYLAWGLLGFLLGAVFWHVVGFWDFLGGIVYKRQQEATIIERVLTMNFAEAEEDRPLVERERQAHQMAQNCTTLVFDRVAGSTTARPCVVIIRNVSEDADSGAPVEVLRTSARLDRPASGR